MSNPIEVSLRTLSTTEAAWVRTAAGVVATISPSRKATIDAGEPSVLLVIGTIDQNIVITNIGRDTQNLLGAAAETLVGTSLAGLIAPDDVVRCESGIREAARNNSIVTMRLTLRIGARTRPGHCELVVLPVAPSSACAFVFTSIVEPARTDRFDHFPGGQPGFDRRDGRVRTLRRLTGDSTSGEMGLLSRLTTRELEVTQHLLAGRRPPAIAAALFVSQSTVRNHLASVFSKFGVTSQQALLDALHANRSPSDAA